MITRSHKVYQSERLRRETEEFLARGGRIREVAPGVSGAEQQGLKRGRAFLPSPPASPRTQIPEIMAAIDARKQAPRLRARNKTRRPKKRYIYDDFGEVVRWEWES